MKTITNYTITTSKHEAQRLVGKLYLEGIFGTPCYGFKVETVKGINNEETYKVIYNYDVEED